MITNVSHSTRPHVKTIPTTENAQIIRTDFSDQMAWESLTATVLQPPDPFIFNMEILDEPDRSGATVQSVRLSCPRRIVLCEIHDDG